MGPKNELVVVVDDDWRVREALGDLLVTLGYDTVTFESLTAYELFERPEIPTCLILDVQLPDMSGLDFQAQHPRGQPPIVFITGYGDVRSSVHAIKRGAVDFLTKPLSEPELLNAINAALERDLAEINTRAEMGSLQRRFQKLTPREREVMPLVVGGLLNKQAAAELGISEVTLQVHRRRIMMKMQAASLAELVRMAVSLGS